MKFNKKVFSLFFSLIFILSSVFTNDYIKVLSDKEMEYHDHETYELWYDTEYNNPAYVIWDLTKDEAINSDNSMGNRPGSHFAKCKSSADEKIYSKSGYDKGHMCPNNDRDWSSSSAKNTFRTCNICPQTPLLNRGIWKKYEEYGHIVAKENELVTIVCGPIYLTESYLGNIRIPDKFYKIFYYNDKCECYIFDQNNNIVETSIEEIEKLANIKIIIL